MHLHPYGTGSLGSELGCGGANALPRLCRNRLLLIQSGFRNNGIYSFFMLQRMIQSHLFHTEAARRRQGRTSAAKNGESTDFVTKYYGTVVPSSVPESTEWHVFLCCPPASPQSLSTAEQECMKKTLQVEDAIETIICYLGPLN